jgi:rhodanese-related sulfurtransferase
MCGRPNTTIGFERLYNPLARLEREQFVAKLGDGVPARPLNMAAIEATNRGRVDEEWAMLTTAPPVETLDLEGLANRPEDAVVLDVREPEEYAHGHVPGAVNVPQAELASTLGELPLDRPLITICQSGYRSLRASQFLKQMGFADVKSVGGGTAAWEEAGKPLSYGDTDVEKPRIVETEWAHAGAGVAGNAGLSP